MLEAVIGIHRTVWLYHVERSSSLNGSVNYYLLVKRAMAVSLYFLLRVNETKILTEQDTDCMVRPIDTINQPRLR